MRSPKTRRATFIGSAGRGEPRKAGSRCRSSREGNGETGRGFSGKTAFPWKGRARRGCARGREGEGGRGENSGGGGEGGMRAVDVGMDGGGEKAGTPGPRHIRPTVLEAMLPEATVPEATVPEARVPEARAR